MGKYIITYDLRHRDKNYTSLYSAIKTNYPKYFHVVENSWVIFTDDTAKEIFDKIKDGFYLSEDGKCADTYVILKLDEGTDSEGLCAKSFWEFMRDETK